MEKRVVLNVTATPLITPGTEVRLWSDSAGSVAAEMFADDGMTAVVQPLLVDTNGEFSYRAADGVYWEQIGSEPLVELTFQEALATMTQVQAEDAVSTVAVKVTGQRVWQAIAKWALTFKTIAGQKDTLHAMQAGATPATVTVDYAMGNAHFCDRVTNNPATLTLAVSNWPTGAGVAGALTLYLKCGANTTLTMPAGFPAVTPVASKTNVIAMSSYYDTAASATVYRAALLEVF